MHKILAIDQSLTASGFCTLIGHPDRREAYFLDTFSPRSTGTHRLWMIEAHVIKQISGKGVELVVIEDYAYAANNGVAKSGELGGVIKLALHKRQMPFVVVSPSSLKQWAGASTKSDIAALEAMYPGPKKTKATERAAWDRWGKGFCADDNQADAAWLAEIGWYLLTGTAGTNEARRKVLATLAKQRG